MTSSLITRITPDIHKISPTKSTLLMSLSCLYIGWCYANLAANGLFALSIARSPGFRLIGEVVYYVGVTLSGIIFPLYFIRRWDLDVHLVPKKIGVSFFIRFLGLMVFAVLLGSAAMTDQGMTLLDLRGKSISYLVSPIPIFLPTMVAYSLLWHVVFFQGFRRVFGKGIRNTGWAIVVTAAVYAVYHVTSIDEIYTLHAMVSEIAITFAIRIVLLLVVATTHCILSVFLCDWVMNYFVFTPMSHFHPAPWKWPLGLIIVVVMWWIFRYWYRADSEMLTETE